MSAWEVVLDPDFLRQLKKLDKPMRGRVLDALERLGTFENPQAHCKALTHNRSGLWRYRVGDYRVILKMYRSRLLIVAVEVGHRSRIYD